jgi:hypothetical protein
MTLRGGRGCSPCDAFATPIAFAAPVMLGTDDVPAVLATFVALAVSAVPAALAMFAVPGVGEMSRSVREPVSAYGAEDEGAVFSGAFSGALLSGFLSLRKIFRSTRTP